MKLEPVDSNMECNIQLNGYELQCVIWALEDRLKDITVKKDKTYTKILINKIKKRRDKIFDNHKKWSDDWND